MKEYEWVKVAENIPIEKVEDEHLEEMDFEPSFWYWNRRYYLCNFILCHNNPWVQDVFPEFIDAFEAGEYFNPLYIEIIDDEKLNIWEEKEMKKEGKEA